MNTAVRMEVGVVVATVGGIERQVVLAGLRLPLGEHLVLHHPQHLQVLAPDLEDDPEVRLQAVDAGVAAQDSVLKGIRVRCEHRTESAEFLIPHLWVFFFCKDGWILILIACSRVDIGFLGSCYVFLLGLHVDAERSQPVLLYTALV